MKKLAIIIDCLDKVYNKNGDIFGGANKLARCFIDFLKRKKSLEIHIFCGLSSIQEMEGIEKIHILGFSSFQNHEKFFQIMKEKTKDFDYVFTNDLLAPFGNVMVHSHSIIYKNKNCKSFLMSFFMNILRFKKVRLFRKQFSKNIKKLITVSKIVKEDYIKNGKIDKDKVFYVYPACEKTDKIYDKKENDIFTFGICAGSAFNKGGHFFILALGILNLFNKNFKAKIINSAIEKDFLMKIMLFLFNLNKKTEVFAYQNEIFKFYSEVDCLVVPSINEAFGLVTLEASSVGTPCLVSNTAGSAEILTDNQNGFIFNRKSFFAIFNLVKKMNYILNISENKYKEISENAKILSKNFSMDDFCQKVLDLITEE